MSNLESRIAALEGAGSGRIVFELWMGRSCPGCGVPIWKLSSTGQTRNMHPDDARGCAKLTRAATPAHVCKVSA